jgi:hypothetical protein
MTMVAGFVCRDGLVIAADRQFTSEETATYQECKLSELRWKNGLAIWGYTTASTDTTRRVKDELSRRFSPDNTVVRADIEDAIASSLRDSLREEEFFGLLFAAWTEDEEKILFSSSGTRVSVVPRCEIIGWSGSTLDRYLRGLYLRMGQLSVWQASVLGMYFILQGKNHNGQYVGGPTDVFIIDKNRKRQEIPIASSRVWETALEMMDQQIASLFTVMTDAEQFHGERHEAISKFLSKADLFGNQVRALKAKEDAP